MKHQLSNILHFQKTLFLPPPLPNSNLLSASLQHGYLQNWRVRQAHDRWECLLINLHEIPTKGMLFFLIYKVINLFLFSFPLIFSFFFSSSFLLPPFLPPSLPAPPSLPPSFLPPLPPSFPLFLPFFLETGPHCVAFALLEFTMYAMLASNLQIYMPASASWVLGLKTCTP